MTIIKTNQRCVCGEFLIKDTCCMNDWYPTCKGEVHQSFCPDDGRMWPLVEEPSVDYISNNNKKRVLNQIARIYNMRFKELNKIFYCFCKEIDDRYDFLYVVSRETGISVEKILPICS